MIVNRVLAVLALIVATFAAYQITPLVFALDQVARNLEVLTSTCAAKEELKVDLLRLHKEDTYE